MNRDVALWIPILGAPVVWFLGFETNFALTPWACAFQWKLAMHIVFAATLAITAGLAIMAWGQWKALGREWPGDRGGAVARSQTMAVLGILMSATAFLVTLAQFVPDILMGACE